MKASMTDAGVIHLEPETSVEAYALKQWASHNFVPMQDHARKENGHWRGSSLVTFGLAPKAPEPREVLS